MKTDNIIRIGEHHEALKILYEREINRSIFFHLDFHIDIAYVNDREYEHIINELQCGKEVIEISEEIWYENKKKNGLHCGNFIYFAIKLGMIKYFIWVMPDEERSYEDVFYHVIQEVGGIAYKDVTNFKRSKDYIAGEIFSVNFIVTTLSKVETVLNMFINENVVLDIDIDILFNVYNKLPYLDTKIFYQSVYNIYKRAELIIICDSVKSGHTPAKYSYIKDYLYELMKNGEWLEYEKIEKSYWQAIHEKQVNTALDLADSELEKALLIVNSMLLVEEEEKQVILNKIENNFLKALLVYKDNDVAEQYFEMAAKEHTDTRFWEYYLEYLLKNKKYTKAEKVMRHCKIVETWRMNFYKGICEYNKKKYKEALEYFERSADMNQINVNIIKYKILCYQKIGLIDKYNENMKCLSVIQNMIHS